MRILWVYSSVALFHAIYEPTPEKREHCAGKSLQGLVKEIRRTIGPIGKQEDVIVVRFSPPGDAVISDRKIRIDLLGFVSLKKEEIEQFIEFFNKTK